MRSRYVKKCSCETPPIVTKRTVVNHKGVLDIDIKVSCPECSRVYKEVPAKMVKMVDPDIVIETSDPPKSEDPSAYGVQPLDDPIELAIPEEGVEDESENGDDKLKSGEGEEFFGKEEEPIDTSPEEEDEVTITDTETASDEEGTPDPVEAFAPPKRGRPKNAVERDILIEVPERTTEEALEDSGVPEEDLF